MDCVEESLENLTESEVLVAANKTVQCLIEVLEQIESECKNLNDDETKNFNEDLAEALKEARDFHLNLSDLVDEKEEESLRQKRQTLTCGQIQNQLNQINAKVERLTRKTNRLTARADRFQAKVDKYQAASLATPRRGLKSYYQTLVRVFTALNKIVLKRLDVFNGRLDAAKVAQTNLLQKQASQCTSTTQGRMTIF